MVSGIKESGSYNINIDFDKMYVNNFHNIVFNRNDINTSKIKVNFLKNGEIVDLTNIHVNVKIINSSFEQFNKSVANINSSEGTIEYVFEKESLIEGIGMFQLALIISDSIKVSPKIRYKVIK